MGTDFALNQDVTVTAVSAKAKVIGIWISAHGETQWLVRYFDTSNRRTDIWCVASEIKA